jgi:hypothetical protein
MTPKSFLNLYPAPLELREKFSDANYMPFKSYLKFEKRETSELIFHMQDPELLRFHFDSGLILDRFFMLNPKIDIKKDFENFFGVCHPLKDENSPLTPFWS